MASTHSVTIGYNDGARTISKTETFGGNTADSESSDVAVTAAVTNLLIPFAVTRSKLQSMMLVCDTACTIKTNTTTGADTWALAANEPWYWSNKTPYCNATTAIPGGDITALYYTQAGATTSSFSARAVQNIT